MGDCYFMDPFDRNSNLSANMKNARHWHLGRTLIHGSDRLGGAANTALSQNALRQDRSWWIVFVICCAIQDWGIYSSGLAWAIYQLKVFF
jgi:hypothetical protein